MNLLAHLYLTDGKPEEVAVGNFIGDHVKGGKYRNYPEGVAEGILLHRFIDSFTDDHPKVMESKRLLHPYHGKWASVFIDVFYDHFLATEWDQYSTATLRGFVGSVHEVLSRNRELMPERARWILDRMIADQWLVHYAEPEGIERALYGLSKRTGEKSFQNGMNTLRELDDPLREKFRQFFPDLVKEIEKRHTLL